MALEAWRAGAEGSGVAEREEVRAAEREGAEAMAGRGVGTVEERAADEAKEATGGRAERVEEPEARAEAREGKGEEEREVERVAVAGNVAEASEDREAAEVTSAVPWA